MWKDESSHCHACSFLNDWQVVFLSRNPFTRAEARQSIVMVYLFTDESIVGAITLREQIIFNFGSKLDILPQPHHRVLVLPPTASDSHWTTSSPLTRASSSTTSPTTDKGPGSQRLVSTLHSLHQPQAICSLFMIASHLDTA